MEDDTVMTVCFRRVHRSTMMASPSLTGVGCTLVPHPPSGALRVSSMDIEGPAAKGGIVAVGDVLFEVDETR